MKRMICVLLTLVMLLSVMPVSASAAGMAVSENAITVLKNLQKYYPRIENGVQVNCIKVGNEYRTGYGTICETCTKAGTIKSHTHSEGQADAALRAKLVELNTAVNNFASNNKITLSQNKFDALVLVSYDIGTAWLAGEGVLKSAVVNGTTGNAFLNAIGQSSALGSDSTDRITGQQRRMIEGNMYLNGTYTDNVPTNYGWVNYDANGGVMAEGTNGLYTQYFDTYFDAKPAPTPTRKGYTFLGWYMDEGNGYFAWCPKLRVFQIEDSGKTLKALWQKNGTTYSNAVGDASNSDYSSLKLNTWLGRDFLASGTVYNVPNGNPTGVIHTSKLARIDRDWIDNAGNRWGRLVSGDVNGGNGWLQISGTPVNPYTFDIDVTVTVTNDILNGRANSNAASEHLMTFHYGDKLRIISTDTTAYKLWGQVADENGVPICWVSLMYTNWNEVKDLAPTDSNNANNTEAIATAVVNCNGYLNVRSAAGTDNAIVGALADGAHVEIYEIKFVNGHQWGRTTGGWILLTYAKVTMLSGNNATFSNTKDVLAYTFTGKVKNDLPGAHTDVVHNSDLVPGSAIKKGTTVAVSMIKNGEGGVWGFNGIGWIKLEDIAMDEAKYVVVADGVTVRSSYDNSASQVEKVTKGVELNISDLAVVDATIWGYSAKYGGWVNLASRFVKRSNAPVIENVTGEIKSEWVATVINTDSVNVRETDTATSKRLGGLGRGISVRVWTHNDEDGVWQNATWFKVDSNQNGIFEDDGDGWVSAQYLDIVWAPIDQEGEGDEGDGSTSGSAPAVIETGLGIVANTYSGVNIRAGAGTGYAATGKYLNGTAVEILEVTTTATSKWGRTVKGWVCMDYVNMVNKYAIGGAAEEQKPAGPNAGGSTTTEEGNVTFTSTPVSYTGSITTEQIEVKKTADVDAIVTTTLGRGTNITVQELRKVVTKKTEDSSDVVDGNATTTTTTTTTHTSYWARINGGWVENPAMHIALNSLEETVYTNAGTTEVDVYSDAGGSYVTSMPKGTQVTITTVKIAEDKVWGFAEDIGTAGGWVRLDRLSQGAHKVEEPKPENNNNNNGANNGGNNFNLGAGGDTTGSVPTGGYRYTGTIINTNQVNVRALPNSNNGTKVTTTLKAGGAVVIYETTINPDDLAAWGRCDAGWVHLYYVDLVPATGDGAVDARVVQTPNAIYYSDSNATNSIGTYAKGSVIDIFEIVGTMAKTNLGWVSINDLLN